MAGRKGRERGTKRNLSCRARQRGGGAGRQPLDPAGKASPGPGRRDPDPTKGVLLYLWTGLDWTGLDPEYRGRTRTRHDGRAGGRHQLSTAASGRGRPCPCVCVPAESKPSAPSPPAPPPTPGSECSRRPWETGTTCDAYYNDASVRRSPPGFLLLASPTLRQAAGAGEAAGRRCEAGGDRGPVIRTGHPAWPRPPSCMARGLDLHLPLLFKVPPAPPRAHRIDRVVTIALRVSSATPTKRLQSQACACRSLGLLLPLAVSVIGTCIYTHKESTRQGHWHWHWHGALPLPARQHDPNQFVQSSSRCSAGGGGGGGCGRGGGGNSQPNRD